MLTPQACANAVHAPLQQCMTTVHCTLVLLYQSAVRHQSDKNCCCAGTSLRFAQQCRALGHGSLHAYSWYAQSARDALGKPRRLWHKTHAVAGQLQGLRAGTSSARSKQVSVEGLVLRVHSTSGWPGPNSSASLCATVALRRWPRVRCWQRACMLESSNASTLHGVC